MNTWLSLTRKELRLGLPAFLMPVIAFIILTGIFSYIGNRSGYGWEAVLGVASFFIAFQVFYLVYYLIYSLNSERKKLHLWLHNPMSGYSLLLSKITSGLLSMVITFIVIGVTLLISYNNTSIHLPLTTEQFINIGIFSSIHIFLFAIDMAVWFIFFWMIFLLITRSLNTFLSFISTFIIFVVFTSIYGWFSESWLYEKLTKWGEIGLYDFITGVSGEVNAENLSIGISNEQFSIYLGAYFFEALITILLFILAGLMLDKKVEV